MKHLLLLMLLCFGCAAIGFFLPFVTFEMPDGAMRTTRGFDSFIRYVPLVVILIIIAIANIHRSRLTAIISFVGCFGLYFSLFLSYFLVTIEAGSLDATYSMNIGFFLIVFSAIAIMLTLFCNLIVKFRPKSS